MIRYFILINLTCMLWKIKMTHPLRHLAKDTPCFVADKWEGSV